MVDVERFVSDVFGSSRPGILAELSKAPLRYTDLAKALKVSEGELSRNLARLVEAGLLAKEPDGRFRVTPLASSANAFAPAFSFLAERAEFVRTHALHELPPKLLLGIDALAHAELVEGPFPLMHAIQSVFESCDRRFYGQWIIGDTVFEEPQLDMQRAFAARLKKNRSEVRAVVLDREVHLYSPIVEGLGAQFRTRRIADAPASLAIGDTMALAQFNDVNGRIDLNVGFFGSDPRFVSWCVDVFEHHWALAREAGPLPMAAPSKAAAVTRAKS